MDPFEFDTRDNIDFLLFNTEGIIEEKGTYYGFM